MPNIPWKKLLPLPSSEQKIVMAKAIGLTVLLLGVLIFLSIFLIIIITIIST